MTLPSIVHPMYLALNRVNIASIRGWHQEGHPAVNILHHKHTMDSEIISRHCTTEICGVQEARWKRKGLNCNLFLPTTKIII